MGNQTDQDSNLTPEELDDLLTELQSRQDVTHTGASSDIVFLKHLVDTAHSAQLQTSVLTRLGGQVRQALSLVPVTQASHLPLAGNAARVSIGPWHFSTALLARYVTLIVTSFMLLVGFMTLSMIAWSSSGQDAHFLTFTPNLSDNRVLLPAHTLPAQDALSTENATLATRQTIQSADKTGIVLHAIQAPSPPSTPLPVSYDANRFTVTPFNQ